MNFLMTGTGASGSWKIRGEQLGREIGAKVQPKALDVGGYHFAIVVKRPPLDLLERLQKAEVPIVWDVVDAWPQPLGNSWGRSECMAWFRQSIQRIKPVAIVAATHAMAEDCAEFKVPVIALPHHGRPGLARNTIRKEVRCIGYEGGEQYLGRWSQSLTAECSRRGWKFVVNPESISDLDIVVALRDWSGYAPRHWKSNVKLANAQASGTPFIGSSEAGYLEMAIQGRERFANTPYEVSVALDQLTPYEERLRVSSSMLVSAPRLSDVATKYKQWLKTICE